MLTRSTLREWFTRDRLFCASFFSFVLLYFLLRAHAGLSMPVFVDESAGFVGGWVVDCGGLLYRDFVDSHGPLQFMFTAAYGDVAGWAHPDRARFIPIVLVVLSGGSVVASPLFVTIQGRITAGALFLGFVAAAWVPQGLYFVNYYSIAGAFAVMALALFALPASYGVAVGARLAFLGGLAAALLGFSAYSYMPTAALFAIAGLWSGLRLRAAKGAWFFIAGGVAGSLAVILWLAAFGDLRGYLAFHIAFGQTAYRPYLDFGLPKFLHSLILSGRPDRVIQSLAVCAMAISALLMARHCILIRKQHWAACPIALFCVFFGVVALNLRGEATFQNGTLVIAAAGLLSLVLARLAEDELAAFTAGRPAIFYAVLFSIVIATAMLAQCAAVSPFDAIVAEIKARKLSLPPPQLQALHIERIRSIVKPGERFLALPYRPQMYLEAGRLPIKGYYAWFPWDVSYARSPWFGRPRDICVSLPQELPPLIFFEPDEKIWSYWPKDYMTCVVRILAQSYRVLPDDPDLYVRLDRADTHLAPNTPLHTDK